MSPTLNLIVQVYLWIGVAWFLVRAAVTGEPLRSIVEAVFWPLALVRLLFRSGITDLSEWLG